MFNLLSISVCVGGGGWTTFELRMKAAHPFQLQMVLKSGLRTRHFGILEMSSLRKKELVGVGQSKGSRVNRNQGKSIKEL